MTDTIPHKGRTYTLAPGVYRADGDKAAYTRQMGFTSLQHEQMVLSYVGQHVLGMPRSF